MAALDVARLEALGFFRYLEPRRRIGATKPRKSRTPFSASPLGVRAIKAMDVFGERGAMVAGSRCCAPCFERIALLNELLTAHGSQERAHALSSGNVLAIVFATEEMARIINEAATPGQRLHDGSLA